FRRNASCFHFFNHCRAWRGSLVPVERHVSFPPTRTRAKIIAPRRYKHSPSRTNFVFSPKPLFPLWTVLSVADVFTAQPPLLPRNGASSFRVARSGFAHD